MTAQKKRDILTGGIVALLIVCAVSARVITRGHRDAAYFLPVSLLRSFIYIGLMTWWGISLWQRIVQKQVRRYLAATAALCVFWLSIRTVKFFFAATPAAIRYLWYGYYFPMLFIPLLCVFVALSLGKPENYRLPKWTSLLYIPTTLLLLLVLTNDLHQLVFVFPADAAAWLDTDHGYGAGYFAVMGYIALGMVTAIIMTLLKCRIPHSRVMLGLPFVPVALADALPNKKHGYIFSPDGGTSPLPGWKLEDLYVGYKTQTSVTVSPHEIRHGYASALYESGVDYKTMQQLLGHAQLATTMDIYTEIFDNRLDDVAAQMDAKF